MSTEFISASKFYSMDKGFLWIMVACTFILFLVALYRKVNGHQSEQVEIKSLGRNEGERLVLFIHGLSGSATGTWDLMLRVFIQDTELKDYAFGCYAYPTSLIGFPWSGRMANIQEIANGLNTHIQTHYGDKKELILVGHSLGGVIARHYILDEMKCHRCEKIKGVALFATPHNGSSLANIGNQFSLRHRHLRQLCKGSDILNLINTDWVKLDIEDKVRTVYIVGGSDSVVAPDSASPYIGRDNVQTLIDYGHTGVIKPNDNSDIRFKVLKKFILETFSCEGVVSKSDITHVNGHGDVLFDFYNSAFEKFYIKRQVDNSLQTATQSANVWVSGAPGVGKTASLKRLAEISGWQLHHVILDSYRNLGALDLMREVCNVLFEKTGLELETIPRDINTPELLGYFRRAFHELTGAMPIAILIEEIPLPPGEAYTEFLDIVYYLSNSTESAVPQRRVIWLFSSIINPRLNIRPGFVKILERIQFLEFAPWDEQEIGTLVDMIVRELQLTISDEERNLIIKSAGGSPRFIKMLYRRKRNEIGNRKTLQELLTSVERDLA